jgi:transposase
MREGKTVSQVSQELLVTRSAINQWLSWYNAEGTEGLKTRKAPGPVPRLTDVQKRSLVRAIEAGPMSAGFSCGVWTGPMIGDFIESHFGVRFHNHYVPDLLHRLGFSVQRPRKRLARADLDAQNIWVSKKFPAIKKKHGDAVDL